MELSFKKNQTLIVDALLAEEETKWWGCFNDCIGIFPSDTVRVLTGEFLLRSSLFEGFASLRSISRYYCCRRP